MTYSTQQLRLANRPVGLPDDSTWEITTEEIGEPGPGEFVVKIDHISLDPAMRGWLNDARSYVPPVELGAVMRAGTTGVVVASQNPDFPVDQPVSGMLGVAEYALSNGEGVSKIDLDVAPAQTWLGALGMPGMTAYFGLTEIGKLQDGDTVVISGAAGAVGSVAGQIAKARGCRVIGIAGGTDKCDWLREIGFDEAIDYKAQDVRRELGNLARHEIDVYFDNVGGEILDHALANLNRGARVVICGAISAYNATSVPPGPSNYMNLLVQRASMEGFLVFDFIDRYAEGIAAISRLISDGSLVARETVVPGGVQAFPETFLGLFDGVNTGKLVLSV